MCTLIVATRVWQSVPLLVAANRDEKLTRKAEKPTLRVEGGLPLFAPRDIEAGGTWLGVNAHGVFVAITNRFAPRKSDRRSRGKLVLDALREPTAAAAMKRINQIDPERHNPFHLIMADAEEAHLMWNDGTIHRHEPLSPGVHVVTERSLNAAPTTRIELLHEKILEIFGESPPEPEQWQELMQTKADEALEGVCVLDEKRGYGTRSSSIVSLTRESEDSTFLHAEGSPDTAEYRDLSDGLRELLAVG